MRDGARRHLERLARAPRPAGSDAERAARAYCGSVLARAGFTVHEEPFAYSALPGRAGTPLIGAAVLAMFLAAGHAGHHHRPVAALVVLAASGAALGLGAWWLTVRGVLRCPWWRARAANLVAVRGEPRVWLVAHLDSKSQPIPIVVRALGVALCLVVWMAALAMAAAQAAGARPGLAWLLLTAFGAAGALPLCASVVGARSVGAVDNASGVAAVLLVAERALPGAGLGVLLTSAEELGLAGARAWVEHAGHPSGSAINFDGLDDTGVVRLTYGGTGYQPLMQALKAAATTEGLRVRCGRLFPGVLLDGVALARSGWRVVTVSRGTLGTVARIHTVRDDLSRLDGEGVAAAARAALGALETLG